MRLHLALGAACCLLPARAAPVAEDPSVERLALGADDECTSSSASDCALEALQLRGQQVRHAEQRRHLEGNFVPGPHWTEFLDTGDPPNIQEEDRSTANVYQECHLSNSTCSLASMGDTPTLVFPGGDTKCINGGAYAFAVVPGDKDKLLFYFEGGGACWKAKGNVVLQCTDTLEKGVWTTGYGNGIQDGDNELNPFRSYTVVEPIYCTGDAHMGTAAQQDWEENKTFYQHGFYNTLAAVNWAKYNFVGELSRLVVSGFSAGSLGTETWARTLLEAFPAERATVLMDSYAGVFPHGTEGPTLQDWGACNASLWSDKLRAECEAGTLTLKEQMKETMAAFPHVAFGNIQSKADGAQRWFFKGLAMSNFMMHAANVNKAGFFAKTNFLFEEYNEFPNYVQIFIDGERHCFTQSPKFYTATTDGPDGGKGQSLQEWVESLVNEGVSRSACAGLLEGVDHSAGHRYCDERLYPKALVVGQ